jgi:hypothetical protein
MRLRGWQVVLVASSLAAGSVALSSTPASASVPVAGSATLAAYFNPIQPGPPEVFLMTGPLPLAIQLSVGNLNTACYGPSSTCYWLAQDDTGATLGTGTCTYTSYTVPATTNPIGKWSLACAGTTAQGTATSFDFTVAGAITELNSSPGGNRGSSGIQYSGAYEAS